MSIIKLNPTYFLKFFYTNEGFAIFTEAILKIIFLLLLLPGIIFQKGDGCFIVVVYQNAGYKAYIPQ